MDRLHEYYRESDFWPQQCCPVHWNLPFDAPIQQSDPAALARWGTPLPAGGGEVGAALERDNAAKRSGDLATILRFGSADFPGLAEADADTKKQMLDAMRESSLLPNRVLGGLQRGDQAVVIDLIDAPEAPRRDDIVCVRRFERKSGDWHQAARNCVSA